MFNLNSVLESMTKGKFNVEKARDFIEQKKELLEKKYHIEAYLKELKSFNSLEKLAILKDIIATNLQNIDFSSPLPGLNAKLSLFCNVKASSDSEIENNDLQGCQLFAVNFAEAAAIKGNKLSASLFSKFSVVRSDFCSSQLSLTRFSNVSLLESRVDENKMQRSSLVDMSITESDFTNNSLQKTEMISTVLNASRLSKIKFTDVRIEDCEFDKCDMQNITFENCVFEGCSFRDIVFPEQQKDVIIADKFFVEKNISSCRSVEEFLSALEESSSCGAAQESKETKNSQEEFSARVMQESEPELQETKHQNAHERPLERKRSGVEKTSHPKKTHKKPSKPKGNQE